MEIFAYIETLPNIVQGILGSALFTLALYIGQKSLAWFNSKYSDDKEVANFFALVAAAVEDESIRTRSYLTCLYGALHYFFKAIIAIVFALLFAQSNQIISVVGYFISTYFLLRALSYTPHVSSFGKTQKERKELLSKALKK